MTFILPNETPEERKAEEERIRATLHPDLRDSFVMLRPGESMSKELMDQLFPPQQRNRALRALVDAVIQYQVTKEMEAEADATETGA